MHQRILKISSNFFLFFLITNNLFGQSYWSFQNDNDLYFSKDYYYSNGLFLDYGTSSIKDSHTSYHYRLGQEIYNPSFRYITDSKSYDYPYSGYLYLSVKQIKTKTDRATELGFTIGVSGEASGARQLQNWYHNTLLNLKDLAWEDAMPQKLLVDLSIKHQREWTIDKDLKFGMEAKSQLGLTKTYVAHAAYLLFNGLSVLSIDHPLLLKQSGFYIGFQQQYLFHDFMIQGPLDNSNTLERELVPYRITFKLGPIFYLNQWVIKGIWNYRSADNRSQRHPWHPYMSVSIGKII